MDILKAELERKKKQLEKDNLLVCLVEYYQWIIQSTL